MDSRFRLVNPPGRRSPPLYNPARTSMPVNIGSSYNSYGAEPYATQPLGGSLHGDPITPRNQAAVDYRNVPAVPTPPQLHKTQQPPVTTATASAPVASQPLHQHHHHHPHSSQESAMHRSHHAQHQSSIGPPGGTTTRSYAVGNDPITRSTSLREPTRSHRKSFSESAQKRPIIITNIAANGSGTATKLTSTARGPPSPTRADHFRPPSAEPVRGSSMRDDSYFAVPATSAALWSRGARYSYSGAPTSSALDTDELRRLRGRHESLLQSAPRTDSFPRGRPASAYVNVPRHSSSGHTSSGLNLAGSASGSGSGVGNFGDQGYEYTKPSDLARYDLTYEQAGPRRSRRDSFDQNYYRPVADHTTKMGRSYGFDSGPRRPAGSSDATNRSGPPPTTRGLDKINKKALADSLALSGSGPVGYEPATSIRSAATQASTPMDRSHRSAYSNDSLTSSNAHASSSLRASSRPRKSGPYPQDEYYRSHYDEDIRDGRGVDRDLDRDYRYRDYRDRDYRDNDRDFARERDELQGRFRGDSPHKNDWERERVRGSREYYADGSTANRAFGILVNSRDHQLRQEQAATVTTAGGSRHDDRRATYADELPRRGHEGMHRDYDGGRYDDIDNGFVRGTTEATKRHEKQPQETDDHMYVRHPREGIHQRDRSDRFEHRGTDREHQRDEEPDPRDSFDSYVQDSREPHSSYNSRTSRRRRDSEVGRDREPRGEPRDEMPDHGVRHERERERQYNLDREQEEEYERERQRAYARDLDYENEPDYNSRPSRRAGDEEAPNTKNSRDHLSADLGVAAATAAAAATVAASTRADGPSRRTSVKSAQTPKLESHSRRHETSRRDRDRVSDSSLDSAENHSQEARRRTLEYYDEQRGSESSHGSRASVYATTAPAPASARDGPDRETERLVRADPANHTPLTSEDEGQEKESKGLGSRKKRQHKGAASFLPTNTEDLKALKAELAALEVKEAKEAQKSKPSRTGKNVTDKSYGDDEKSSSPREDSVSKASKTTKADASSPSILTPSSSLLSEPSSPKLGAADKLDDSFNAAGANKDRDGKGKERETPQNKASEPTSDHPDDSLQANAAESRAQGDAQRGRDPSQPPSSGAVVRLVSPPRDADEKRPVKSILKTPKDKFPEEANPIREGVAPHKDDKTKQQGVPPGARWTRISRKLVNPEALTIGKERFEVRDDFVIVLRVLSREEIEAYTIATAQIRDQHQKEYDRSMRQRDDRDNKNKDDDRDEPRDDGTRYHHRSRRERDRDRDRDFDRNDQDIDYYGGSGSTKDLPSRHRRHGSESYANDVMDSRQPTIEYHGSRSSNRQYHRK
ncbi:hypothetical protein SEPCBS119000_004654 [Sporothrix epigloea]|uniref:DUF8035 domain-containing protein n=1 Tax=Sporothrix epigloea TaxID=1892477 RepID=A0ABP0DXA5_9PEZI